MTREKTPKNASGKIFFWILAALLAIRISASDDGQPQWIKSPRIEGIIANIPRLENPSPKSWQPSLFWWQVPLSFDDPVKLKKELTALKERGFTATIGLSAEYKTKPEITEKQIAECKAIADAGFPVQIQMLGGLDVYLTPDGERICHADSPDKGKKDSVGATFPCLMLKGGWVARANHIRELMKKLADSNVPVAAVWYDYERHPHPWNGILRHSKACPSCREQIPEKAFKSFNHFIKWVYDLRDQVLVEVFANPVREVFPSARIGFYSYVPSSEEFPLMGSVTNPIEIDAAMPRCYADPQLANKFFNSEWGLSKREMDPVFFLTLLGKVSGVVRNIRPNQVMIPFVSSCTGSKTVKSLPRMSKPMYREFLRHAVLRGAKGFYCFNVAPPYNDMGDYYNELVDINAVLDEMFAFHDFLDGGETLNHECPFPKTEKNAETDWGNPGVPNTQTWCRLGIVDDARKWIPTPKVKDAVIWSGIRKGDKALVRVVTMGPKSEFVNVTPFPEMTVRLIATPSGKTYVINKSGQIQAFD